MGNTRWLSGVEATRVAQDVEWDDGRAERTASPQGPDPKARQGRRGTPKKATIKSAGDGARADRRR